VVLRDGTIAERGTHRELLALGGLYAQMWDRQREATEAEELMRRTHADREGFVKEVAAE
jgi:ATP-binding cassette, subfamily B, heavy metal transporter